MNAQHDSDQVFPQRLSEAIAHLSPQRRQRLEQAMDERGFDGGIKGGLARLSGMSSLSTLSDILSGRIRGQRYRESLAHWLGVDRSWLEGNDQRAPEWALSPAAAYERWLRQVRISWQAWFIDQRGGPSATTAMGLRLNSASGNFALSDGERRELAQRLELSIDDPVLHHLSHGAWHAIPFAMQLAIAEELGAPLPEDPEHVAAGHQATQQAVAEKDELIERFRHQYLRHALPPRLFQVTRLALVSLLQQRAYQGKDTEAIADALELLWRQHLEHSGRQCATPPPALQEETGRTNWTPLATLQQRYQDQHPEAGDARYTSQPPPSAPPQ